MSATSYLNLMMDAWDELLLTTPDPFSSSNLYDYFTGHVTSYRECLDQEEVNYLGNVIPRIAKVKRHIRALRDPHLPPSRLP